MKHLLTKTNGSSVYKTQGAAKQAANRFLKANQGDYRMDIQQVEGGFEVTMVKLVEALDVANDVLAENIKLKEENDRLSKDNKKGMEAIAALEIMVATYNNHGIHYIAPNLVRSNDVDPENQVDDRFLDEIYIANELAYGLAMEVTQGVNPLKKLETLIRGGYTQVQQDKDGYVSLKLPHSNTPISELSYAAYKNDLLAMKMKLYAELQPENLEEIDDIKYDSGHDSAIHKMNHSNEAIDSEGMF